MEEGSKIVRQRGQPASRTRTPKVEALFPAELQVVAPTSDLTALLILGSPPRGHPRKSANSGFFSPGKHTLVFG